MTRLPSRKESEMRKTDMKMDLLIKEVEEYHAYHGDQKVEFVRMLETVLPIDIYFLVRVVDAKGHKLSVIHFLDTKGNGDYYVTELGYDNRRNEARLVRRFENR